MRNTRVHLCSVKKDKKPDRESGLNMGGRSDASFCVLRIFPLCSIHSATITISVGFTVIGDGRYLVSWRFLLVRISLPACISCTHLVQESLTKEGGKGVRRRGGTGTREGAGIGLLAPSPSFFSFFPKNYLVEWRTLITRAISRNKHH